MLKLTVLVGMLMLFAMAGPAHALVSYTFTGPGGLEGTVLLDDSVPFLITHGGFGTSANLASPLNFISGRFGEFTFFGRPVLNIGVDERPDPPLGKQNSWIFDSQVVGPPVGKVVPTQIRLGYAVGPAFVNISLTPPTPSGVGPDTLFFGVFFSDFNGGNCPRPCAEPVTISGPVSVPEPAVAVLLILSLPTVLIFHRRRWRHPRG